LIVFPLSPRELRRQLRRLGISMNELSGVKSVVIDLGTEEIIITNPQVIVISGPGQQKIYQIVGTESKVPKEGVSEVKESITKVEFSEDDIKFVMEQGGVDRVTAIQALKEAGGDIAKALLIIEERKLGRS